MQNLCSSQSAAWRMQVSVEAGQSHYGILLATARIVIAIYLIRHYDQKL